MFRPECTQDRCVALLFVCWPILWAAIWFPCSACVCSVYRKRYVYCCNDRYWAVFEPTGIGVIANSLEEKKRKIN